MIKFENRLIQILLWHTYNSRKTSSEESLSMSSSGESFRVLLSCFNNEDSYVGVVSRVISSHSETTEYFLLWTSLLLKKERACAENVAIYPWVKSLLLPILLQLLSPFCNILYTPLFIFSMLSGLRKCFKPKSTILNSRNSQIVSDLSRCSSLFRL